MPEACMASSLKLKQRSHMHAGLLDIFTSTISLRIFPILVYIFLRAITAGGHLDEFDLSHVLRKLTYPHILKLNSQPKAVCGFKGCYMHFLWLTLMMLFLQLLFCYKNGFSLTVSILCFAADTILSVWKWDWDSIILQTFCKEHFHL